MFLSPSTCKHHLGPLLMHLPFAHHKDREIQEKDRRTDIQRGKADREIELLKEEEGQLRQKYKKRYQRREEDGMNNRKKYKKKEV